LYLIIPADLLHFAAWFMYWGFVANTAPFWPPLLVSTVFALRAQKYDAAGLTTRLRWLTISWFFAILVSVVWWQPRVMEW